MCLIVFSYEQHPRYRLVFGANRDEFYERPTAQADFWEDAPDVLAGRDLQGGGTWMGVTRNGRFAALSNFRDPEREKPDAPTRGVLVANYLRGQDSAREYVDRVASSAGRYNGFNLVVGDHEEIYYFSNRGSGIQLLEPGLYGLSNDLLDTPWPKVKRAKTRLADIAEGDDVDPEDLLRLLSDEESAPEGALPDTGVGPEWERVLSSIFITSRAYGTRSSSVLLIDREDHLTFVERTYTPDKTSETRRFEFDIDPELVSNR